MTSCQVQINRNYRLLLNMGLNALKVLKKKGQQFITNGFLN